MMSLKVIFRKLFISGEWRIAVRRTSSSDFYDDSFISIPNNENFWFADPLLFEEEGQVYLFCEAFDRKELKGKIGYFTLKDNTVSDFKLLIDENYHMSFPNVFKYEGNYFMIPETSENLSLDLYVAEEFPQKWTKYKTLVKGFNYVDPTLVIVSGKVFLFVYIDCKGEYQTHIYKISTGFDLKLVQKINYAQNVGRSAGKTFYNCQSEVVRPVQMSEGEYGKETLFYKLIFKEDSFSEIKIGSIDNSRVKVDFRVGVNRIHTYCKSATFEAIDYTIYRFDLLKRIKILLRNYKKKNRGK